MWDQTNVLEFGVDTTRDKHFLIDSSPCVHKVAVIASESISLLLDVILLEQVGCLCSFVIPFEHGFTFNANFVIRTTGDDDIEKQLELDEVRRAPFHRRLTLPETAERTNEAPGAHAAVQTSLVAAAATAAVGRKVIVRVAVVAAAVAFGIRKPCPEDRASV